MAQPTQMLNVAIDFLKTNYKFDTFHEPRGVMRIFQFVFSIWGFFAVRDFTFTLFMDCVDSNYLQHYKIEYPFEFNELVCRRKIIEDGAKIKIDNSTTGQFLLFADASTGAQFFAMTAVLSFLYALFIIIVYTYLDEMYKSKPEFPMADFSLTAAMAFFWLICTLALNSGANALKKVFNEDYIGKTCYQCDPHVSSFTDLTIALLIGFLNFFLWTSDLWFLYKETIWFQNRGAIYNQNMYAQQQQQHDAYAQHQQLGQTSYDQQQQFTQPQQPQYDQSYVQQQQPQYGQSYGQQQYGQM